MVDVFTHIFWDFDGTLCDSEADIRNAWKKTFSAENLVCRAFDSIFKVGPALPDMTLQLFPKKSEEARQHIMSTFKRIYDLSTFDETTPYPWITDSLKKFFEQGIKLYVITNKRKLPTAFLLKKNGWTGLFSGAYTPDIVDGKTLRKKDLIALALSDCRALPEKTLMVGDTAADVEAGKENGVKTAGVLWGYGSKIELENAGADMILSADDFRTSDCIFSR